MDKSKHEGKVGAELIVSILREADEPLTTKQLQAETKKVVSFCLADSIVSLNLMRIRGIIKGRKTEDKTWVWYIED